MPDALIVGAGVFGASIAHQLAGSGWQVKLVEQYQPGHVRAASGGESRLIRCSHGADSWYTASARRALDLWQGLEEEAGAELLVRPGVVWFAAHTDGWEAKSEAVLRQQGVPVEHLDPADVTGLFPEVRTDDLAFGLYEPQSGMLRAREAVRVLASQALLRGVQLVSGTARPVGRAVEVEERLLEADVVVWACGPWLAGLFPGLTELRVTQQDVFFFGAGAEWSTPPVPGWVDHAGAAYGLGDLDGRGVKVAPDVEGPPFDPERGLRQPLADNQQRARGYLAWRFPSLADAPLVGTRTCAYSLTADANFIIAPHPELPDVWLVGGGSGHGFKHGPALAEYVQRLLEGRESPDPRFRLGPRPIERSLRTAGVGPPIPH